MKRVILAMILATSIALVGCGESGTGKRAIEEGKIAFASKEYDKAEGIFKLAISENGGKEAEALYNQIAAFRIIKDEISSTEFAETFGLISNSEVINSFFKILDNLKIIEENKAESTIVIDELADIYVDVKESIIELLTTYQEYVSDLDIQSATEYLDYINRIASYNFEFLEDNQLDVKFYEGLLEDAKVSLDESVNSGEGYTKEAIDSVLNERFGGSDTSGASLSENITTMNGEPCYEGQAFWNSGNRIRNFYVGTVTGSIYNDFEEKVGTLETFNFGDIE